MNTYIPQQTSLAAKVVRALAADPDLEELSIAEIARRFEARGAAHVNPCLLSPVTHRVLDRTRNAAGHLVYRRGRAFDSTWRLMQRGEITPPTAEQRQQLEARLAQVDPEIAAAATVAPPAPAAPPATMPASPAPAQPGSSEGRESLSDKAPPVRAKGPARGVQALRLPDLDVDALPVLETPAPAAAAQGASRYDAIFERARKLPPGQGLAVPIAFRGALGGAARRYRKLHGVQMLIRVIDAEQCGVWAPAKESKS